jgi:hypothetical protein
MSSSVVGFLLHSLNIIEVVNINIRITGYFFGLFIPNQIIPSKTICVIDPTKNLIIPRA